MIALHWLWELNNWANRIPLFILFAISDLVFYRWGFSRGTEQNS